ncbi:MAG TPA: Hpt domain-containing protein, partial [Bryobacteraceae bacterium]|nr:Hpt domain-containing protein [Bryobacteraceae bacterium]
MSRTGDIPGELSLLDLFRMEVQSQAALLTEGILALERGANPQERTPEMMRAAHSLKGAARIIGREPAVQLSHALEDCMAGFRGTRCGLSPPLINTLLRTVDMLNLIAQVSDEDFDTWRQEQQSAMQALMEELSLRATNTPGEPAPGESIPAVEPEPPAGPDPLAGPATAALRVTAGNLNRLMAVAGETAVATRWLDSHLANMLRLKKLQQEMGRRLEEIRCTLPPSALSDELSRKLLLARDQENECKAFLAERIDDVDLFSRRMTALSRRLSDEVLDCRMRPFADGIGGFPRMVRDLANSLGKSVKFEIAGESTPVDREILERLKPPVTHLLRNAVDHGIESSAERARAGKPKEATLRLEAVHRAGMLVVTVSDDGRGLDIEAVRSAVVRKKLSTPEISRKLSEAELLEFLFLPGFSLRDTVSEISGRGVGLDVVR